jgi:predicted exporter
VVVVTGHDEQQALARNDLATAALVAAERAGELDGHVGVGALLPSVVQQQAVDAAVRADATLWPRLREALVQGGFVATAFAPFADGLAAPPPPPLVPADLQGTPLQTLVRPFRADGEHGVAWLNFLHGLRDEPALRRRVEAIDGAQLLDIEGALTGALADYRTRMQELLLLGLVAVVLLVALRHRAVRPTLIACLPALVAALATMSLLALFGVSMNLLSLVALLMVVSMGVDYGIFLTADEADPAGRQATQFSILLASLTTVLGFGLLALSQQPALFRIGATSGVGILFCLLLALSVAAVAAPRRP